MSLKTAHSLPRWVKACVHLEVWPLEPAHAVQASDNQCNDTDESCNDRVHLKNGDRHS